MKNINDHNPYEENLDSWIVDFVLFIRCPTLIFESCNSIISATIPLSSTSELMSFWVLGANDDSDVDFCILLDPKVFLSLFSLRIFAYLVSSSSLRVFISNKLWAFFDLFYIFNVWIISFSSAFYFLYFSIFLFNFAPSLLSISSFLNSWFVFSRSSFSNSHLLLSSISARFAIFSFSEITSLSWLETFWCYLSFAVIYFWSPFTLF